MKIPEGKIISSEAKAAWEHAAAQIGIKYGIFVEIKQYWDHPNYLAIRRICFVFDDQEFETLPELERVLALKAFL